MQRQATASTRVRLVAPIRAALYARVSSDQQAERHTIASQVAALLARAAADGHEVAPELRFRLCWPGPVREGDLASLATNAAPGAGPCPGPQAPIPPGPGPAREPDRHPGPSADRCCAV